MSGYDPTDLRGQEVAAEKSAEQVRLDRETEVADFKWVLSSKRGRRYIWRLLGTTGVFRSSFTGNSTTFFNEGMRNIGLQVLAMIHEHCPEAYGLMLSEQREHGRSNDQRTSDH